MKRSVYLLVLLLLVSMVSAEVLILNVNKIEYTEGETARVFGYVYDDSYNAQNNTAVSISYDDTLLTTATTDSEGYFEYFITNLTAGNHNVSANTSASYSLLTFTVVATAQATNYEIISDSLSVPYSNPVFTFTVNKYVGSVLSSDAYSYNIYYENGTNYSVGNSATSGNETNQTLPQMVGIYTFIIDNKMSFTVSVTRFTLRYDITDKTGNPKYLFKPGGIAYFSVEGFSNGQRITDATVTAEVTDPTGTIKTVTFTEDEGVYEGNTNETQSTPIQLRAGEYEVEFKLEDSSGNEQKVRGFFKVKGLNVEVELVDKKPYQTGEDAEFDIIVKNLDNGNLVSHGDITYTLEIETDGDLYDASSVVKSASSDPTISSEFTYTIPADLADGGYLLKVRASSDDKSGEGFDYFEILNNEVWVEITDNFGGFRDFFRPNELAKIEVDADQSLTFLLVNIYNEAGVLQSSENTSLNDTEGYVTLNAPSTQGDYRANVKVTTQDGDTIIGDRWFSVQNYMSWLDTKDLDNNWEFLFDTNESFLTEINVFDIATGDPVDLTNFVVRFDLIIEEETQQEYTNFQTTENNTYTDRSNGRVTYNFVPPTLTNGVYRIDYTVINTLGESFKGHGWFGISSFDVDVYTYSSTGQPKEVFSSGESVNVTVNLSDSFNGTAWMHREFFDPLSFSILDGTGSTLLTVADGKLPSQSGFYWFGIEVEEDDGDRGFGDGFFEIKNLNFRSINVRQNGAFVPGDDIVADVVVEKSGELVNQSNVSFARMFRAWDGSEVSATSTPQMTTDLGRATMTITPDSTLEPGDYFVELKAKKGAATAYEGFGFRVVEDKVQISVNDADKIFSTTDNIEVNVLVSYQNDTPKDNVSVNLTSLLNLNTWGPVTVSKQASTSSNGIASFTLSAANFNPARYAPVIKVAGMQGTVVGFGDGEFEIVPFTASVTYQGDESFNVDEDIAFDIAVTGTVTVTASVKDINEVTQEVDYYYTDNVLTINNDLPPGEYFVDVTITQSSTQVTERLWIEVVAPWAHIDPLPNPTFEQNDTLNFTYVIFTTAGGAWEESEGTLIIDEIESMWTGNTTEVGINISGNGTGNYSLDLSTYSLSKGDYFLKFLLAENPDYDMSLYFRVDKDVTIIMNPQTDPDSPNVTVEINTTGLNAPVYILDGYSNYEDFDDPYTSVGTQVASGQDASFTLTNLDNGFYQADIRAVDGADTYYWNTFWEIRVREVDITAPGSANVGENVTFDINSSTDTYFWIIDPFTQVVQYSQAITSGDTQVVFQFPYSGWFLYSYGADKWSSFPNAEEIEIIQSGFSVEWPFEDNMYVLSGGRNFTFNVTSDLENTSMTLNIKNFFTGNTVTKTDLLTHETGGTKKTFTYDLQSDLNLENGPHDIELILEDGSSEPPKQFFFIDVFPDQYEMWAWTDSWEYSAGDTIRINIDVFDVTNFWSKEIPDNVIISEFTDPFGATFDPSMSWSPGQDYATITVDSSWVSGNYHAEIQITEDTTTKTVPFDFFVRGNDNLEVNWWQNQWDVSSSDTFEVDIDVRDNGAPAPGIQAALVRFEKWPENYNEDPIDALANISSAFNFSEPTNTTDSNGNIVFNIDLAQAPTLGIGGYSGTLNIGGRQIWFDFNIQSYMLDAYPEEWEYGLTDTIEINVRARDHTTWDPIDDDGNVTIERVTRYDPAMWEPVDVPLHYLSIIDPVYNITGGGGLIELQANTSAMNLTKPYEFELKLSSDLAVNGESEGWVWFRLSNTARPSASIIDSTGSVPDVMFPDNTYTLSVDNVNSATLMNIWGPCGNYYNQSLSNNSGNFTYNFTSPQCPGWYTMEIMYDRGTGWSEYMYTDFQIGSGAEMNMWGSSNVVPDINFTVYVELFGEGIDPWCEADPWCTQDWTWFGPLPNKTINLTAIKDLENFTETDISSSGISAVTSEFPVWMFPPSQDCMQLSTQETCEDVTGCEWDTEDELCDMAMMGDPDGPMDPIDTMGGVAAFTLNPTDLGLQAGKIYDLVFTYMDDEGEALSERYFIQVEEFHVAISRRESNVGTNSEQYVWLKTTDLFGVPKPSCDIQFTSIYSTKDYQLAKNIDISNQTDENGTLVFTYTAPSLPGEYLVEGVAACNVSDENKTQEISYFIDVGSKNMDVDMKTRFKEGENIKVSITTKDRLGNPESKRVNLNLFHDRDDYPFPVYSLGGSDCVVLDANQGWDHGGGDEFVNNMLEIETDADGKYEVEICPLPTGMYMMDIFPMFDFDEGGGDFMMGPGDEQGFFTDFIVSSADITIYTDQFTYEVGDTVDVYISAFDEDGEPMNGSIIVADSFLEDFASGAELLIWEMDEETELLNGTALFSYTLPAEAPNDMNDSQNVTVTTGPVDIYLMIEDTDENTYVHEAMLYTVKRNNLTNMSAPSEVKTNRLIDIHVDTDDENRYKVQTGVFFLQDNDEKMKDWMIEGGVFLQDDGDGTSSADFQILSPREPGSYYLGLMVYELSQSAMSMSGAHTLLIAPIEVTLDLVNVTGNVTETDGTTPIEGATVKIGKVEATTDSSGQFTMQVPKGKYRAEIEKKVSTGYWQSMKADEYNFDSDVEVIAQFYRIGLAGNLQQTLFNISSPSTDLSTMKLRINVSINNTGSENLTNLTAKAIARSGEEIKYKDVLASGTNFAFFRNLYAGFETKDDYKLSIKVSDNDWDGSSYIQINGSDINSTVAAKLSKEYAVETYAVPGDGMDNDNDCQANTTQLDGCTPHNTWWEGKCIDEEIDNNKDDDCDGRIDEDLEGEDYWEWCGNGFCSSEEFDEDTCFEDCGEGSYCGDGNCDSGEGSWCFEDCSGSVESCSTPNECLDGPFFCNSWNITEDAPWCESTCNTDNCWACDISGAPGNTECENAGCTLGQDQYGTWCYMEEACSDDSCWACHSEEDCAGTSQGMCEWENDTWSPDGGWCERPWDCDVECNACDTYEDCMDSNATMQNVSCMWDNYGYCVWNFTYVPMGGIENIWLGETNTTDDFDSAIDYMCWSGNCGSEVDAGLYYILLRIDDLEVNVSVNGTVIDTIDNTGGYMDMFSTSAPYMFNNGSYFIEVEEVDGPEYRSWYVDIGQESYSAFCGDFSVEGDEECDEGGNATINCTATCEWTDCGDGTVQNPNYYGGSEQCDDGNTVPGDGCDASCQIEVADNLSITKTCLNCPVDLGDTAVFEIVAENLGSQNYTDLTILDEYDSYYINFSSSDTLPEAVNYTGAEAEWVFNLSGGENFTLYVNFTTLNVGTTNNNAYLEDENQSFDQDFEGFSINAPPPGMFMLSGQVLDSSGIDNVTVDVFYQENDSFLMSTNTNSSGDYEVVLEQGIYTLQFRPPMSYDFNTQVIVMDINLTQNETLDVQLPQIFTGAIVNGVFRDPAVNFSLPNGTQANFSLFVNNTEDYTVNFSMEMNATSFGDTYYDTAYALIAPSSVDTSSINYTFTPTLLTTDMLFYDILGSTQNNSDLVNTSLGFYGVGMDMWSQPLTIEVTGG